MTENIGKITLDLSKYPGEDFYCDGAVEDEILEIMKDIRVSLPDEIKQAKWVKEERQRILLEAQKEASTIIKEAETKIVSMIDENEITRQAYNQANETIINAQKTARDIKLGALDYTDELLAKIEEKLSSIKASILLEMESTGAQTWLTDTMRISRKLPSTRTSFNLVAFKSDHPDLEYDAYMKTTQVGGSLQIAI